MPVMYEFDGYDEILKCYEGVTDQHASTSFEVGLMNDLYYQLFREDFYMTGIELFILIGGCYALYTVGMAIATELDYRASNQKRNSAYDS